jgi:hypothetical protein
VLFPVTKKSSFKSIKLFSPATLQNENHHNTPHSYTQRQCHQLVWTKHHNYPLSKPLSMMTILVNDQWGVIIIVGSRTPLLRLAFFVSVEFSTIVIHKTEKFVLRIPTHDVDGDQCQLRLSFL